jgi:hypothetical protein
VANGSRREHSQPIEQLLVGSTYPSWAYLPFTNQRTPVADGCAADDGVVGWM